ncbi:MAG: polysaccharide biosynthesis C-terminal domain-containing protein, partial [Ignavibacteria bacterium]|nr:polysaccharide biosynthesis C-terminal domain-containing protein [Ignavibacteria bacterium]
AGRGLGFLREVVYAGYFGIGDQFDLFLVSAVFPITINTVIYYLGQNYFIPAYNKAVNLKKSESDKLLSQTLIIFFIGGILISVFLFLISDFIFDLYLKSSSAQIKNTASTIFNIFLTTIPLFSCTSILSSYLHAKLEYSFPAVSRLFLNICIIFLILMFTNKLGIYVIPIGYALGVLIQFIYLFVMSFKFGELKTILFRLDRALLLKNIKSSILIIILIESISQLYLIADRFFYSSLPSGGIASLNYAFNLFVFPIAVFSFAITTAIFPRISDAFVKSADTEIRKIAFESVSATIVIFTPIAFLFIFFSEPIIKLVFERGSFSSEATIMTAEVLKIYGLSLIFYSVYTVMNKILYSAELLKQLLFITIAGIIIKLLINFISVDSLNQSGLAMGTAVSYISFLFFSVYLINKHLKINFTRKIIYDLLFNLVNASVCFVIILIICKLFIQGNFFTQIFFLTIFVAIFISNLVLLNHPSTEIILNLFKKIRCKIY